MTDEIEQFLNKYEAHASLSDRKHYARRMPMSVSDFRYSTAMDVYDYESRISREPYVEMYIPQHKFQEIVERDMYYRQMEVEMDQAARIARQQAEDRLVRMQNPAVKKAYEKYQMLLEMTRK